MKLGWLFSLFGILGAVVIHGGILAFGGWFFLKEEEDRGTTQEVELLSADDAEEEEKKDEPKPETDPEEQIEAEAEEAPDAAEMIRNLELSSVQAVPALDDSSLGAIEAALSGLSGGGFGDVTSLVGGGRIGGAGDPTALGGKLDDIFSLTEIDQKPRVVFQAAPLFPSEMRGKKVEGVVTLIFVVDPSGKVSAPRVEKSSHPAFEKPALDAIKQWKFEPAVKGGERVGCKMRQSIRFQPS